MPDVLFILLLALVVFGPKKLPEIAGQIGKYLQQFRRMKSELLDQISSEASLIEQQRRTHTAPDGGSNLTEPAKAAEAATQA